MARKVIDIGVVGNDGTGDSIRDSFRKVNENFRELYGALGLGSRLRFQTLEDAPPGGTDDAYYQGYENAIVAVNASESGLVFKQLIAGTGISLNFSNENELEIINTRSAVANDPAPSLGGDLNVQSAGITHRIYGMDQDPTSADEAVSKSYADTKIGLGGVNTPDPAAGNVPNSAFGTMTGPLILSRNPEPEDDVTYGGLIAATKNYVDNAGYASKVNLYVSTDGEDERIGVGSSTQGRALPFAYKTLEAALKKAEEIIKSSPPEIGPYKKVLTWTNPDSGQVNDCTLTEIQVSPESGSGFAGRVTLTVDTIQLITGGFNFQVGEILKIKPEGSADIDAATIQILTVNSEPGTPNGPILTYKLITGGKFDAGLGGAGYGLPATNGNGYVYWSGTVPGSTYGTSAEFLIKYKVSTAIIENGGTDYSLVSVRVSPAAGDDNAVAGFGFADISSGAVAGITITDGGSGFTEFPELIVNLPRFAIYTGGQRTDFTGDVTTDSAEARRGRDIREGLYLLGESSGALAQILAHQGELDTSGNELFDIDIKYGTFEDGEKISYGDVANTTQVAVFVESGIYYENLPLRIPQNVAIIGDEFRRTIIRPKKGMSTSPWAFQYFRRDRVVDGLSTARNEYNAAREDEYGYHYLGNADEPVYDEALINNKGYYRSAADLLVLNKQFIQEEVITWINKQIAEEKDPFVGFEYNSDICKRDVGLLIDSIAYDLRWGSAPRTISAALKYKDVTNTSAQLAITTQLDQTIAAMRRMETVMQAVIRNIDIDNSSYLQPITGTEIVYTEPQIIDTAYTAESGAGGSPITVATVTRGVTTTINTSGAHGLSNGEIVTFRNMTGMTNLNGKSYWITVATSTSFIIYTNETRDEPVNSTSWNTYTSSSGDCIPNGGVIGRLVDAIIDIIDSSSSSYNEPLNNDQMDVFLCNDAVIGRAMTIQGAGGFACVLDPEGQILAKSPYFQEGAVFSKSTGRQTFAGGMFIDGFAGNIKFRITNKISNTRLEVSDLQRFPQLPASFIVEDSVYRINYVRDFTYGTNGSTATFVLDETTPWPYPVFDYNETVCNRDVGLIIDGVGYDIVFGSNYWSRKAGLTYRQANAHVVIEDQLNLTIRAIDRAHDKADAVIAALTPASSYTSSRSIISQSKTNLRNIIRRGTTAAPTLSIPTPAGRTNYSRYNNAKNIILNNIEFIKAEVIGYIDNTYNVYDRLKCYRDVGLILEAVLNDLSFGSNYYSTTAGLAYYRNLASSLYVLSDQKTQTIAGINKARDLANALISDSGIRALITANFAIVTTIINSGTGSAPSLTYPTPAAMTGTLLNYRYAKDQLVANKAFIQEEIYRWIEAEKAASSSPFSPGYTYDSTKCKRDVGYLIDAFCFDLMYGGNAATVAAANTYFYGTTVISGQVEGTVAAYGRLKTVVQQVILETLVTKSSGNALTQDTSGTASNSTVSTVLGTLVDNTITIVNSGSVTTTAHSYSTYGTASYVSARATILSSETTIQTATVDWLEANDYVLTYDETKCARDVAYICEAIAYDLTYGGNSQSWDAAYRYFNGVGEVETQQIPSDQLTETIGAITWLKDILSAVVQGLAPASIYSTVTQTTDNPSDSTAAAEVEILIDLVIDTLTSGVNYLDGVSISYPNLGVFGYDTGDLAARTALQSSKSTIQTDVITFVNDNANVYEVLMPGNRSMLSNDFTQICDMGYGLVTANGGLAEAVSMFTYYCYTSYYSLTGGQIRSVGGSSSHGVYALAAEGSDPLEVPTAVDLYYELTQGAVVYNDGGAYDNAEKGFIVYITDYDYPPRDGSEFEVDHGGTIGVVRYPVVSAVSETDFPLDSTGQRLYRLNLNSDTDGLLAEIPTGTRITLRVNTEIVLTGDVVGVAVRPSTALKLNELFDKQLYRVLEFADYFTPENENIVCTFSIGTETLVTSSAPHGQKPGYQVMFGTSNTLPTGIIAGDTYYVLDDGWTETTFKFSTTKTGVPVETTATGTGTHYFHATGLAATALKDGYNYAELTLWPRQEYVTYGPRLIQSAIELTAGVSYYIVSSGTTTWTSLGAASNSAGTVFTATGSGSGTGYAVVNNRRCTFDYTTDTITCNSHGFNNGDVIRFDAYGTIPTNLFTSRQYFVYNKSANTFQVVGYPGSTAVIDFEDNGSGIFAVHKVQGRVGDNSVAVVEIGPNDKDRIVGMKFGFKGRLYTITQYDDPDLTGESYAKLYFTPSLEDSLVYTESPITLFAGVAARSDGSEGTLTIRISLTRVTSHDLLDIGTGSYADTNYPNEIYGPPVRIATETLLDTTGEVEYAQVVERGEGRCFFVTTDQFGNFSVGPFFRVDQGTGTVTFSASLALSNLSGLGFKRGVPIAEFSTDTTFSDNATDTVPTENAARGYIDRRLGVTHGGDNVDEGRLIPATTGGFMALTGQLPMKGNMNLDDYRIRNVGDPVDPQDAVNYRSISFDAIIANSFSGQQTAAGYMIAFTGDGYEGRAVEVTGDLTIPGDNAITTGVDSSQNQLNIFIKPNIIDNDNINSAAAIAQSKLAMVTASTRASATGITQADRGLASFNSAEFTVTSGWVELKTNSIALGKIAQIGSDTVLGNSTGSTGDVTAVSFTTIVDEGLGIKKSQYSSTGFLRRTGTTTFSQDTDYGVVEAVSGYAGFTDVASNNKLVIRDASGDFGGRDIYASRTLYIGTSASANKKLSDTSVTATGGSVNLYGFNGILGISVGDGSLTSDKISVYRNNSHRFRLNDDSAFAPIQVSQITADTFTTGGVSTAGTLTGAFTLSGTSGITLGTGTINASAGTLQSTTLTTGAVSTAGSITGAWTLQGASKVVGQSTSEIDFSSGTIKSRTFTTGGAVTTGTLTGNWSLSSGSKIDFTNGTLQSTTLTTGATATAGSIVGQWTVQAGSAINTGSSALTTTDITTGGVATAGTITGDWSMVGASNITWGTGYLDMRSGTFYTDTITTGAAGTSGVITGNWSMSTTSNLTLGTGTIDASTGTLKSITLTTGASGTAGTITGAWTVNSGSSFVATSIVNQANSATTTATNANTGSTIVLRDSSGNFSAGTITATLSGTASNITSQANSATITAASTNTANQIVLRDSSGNFSAGTITANLTGDVTGNVSGSSGSCTGNAATVTNGVYTTGSYTDPSWLTITKSKVGLSNVDNTADANKSVNYATSAGGITSQANSATITATSSNTANQIVLRDGSGNFSAGVITGTATAARYADLAERYETDREYAVGTVVVFGGDKEITTSTSRMDTKVAGVISTNPAYMMNSEAGNDKTHPYVALVGRVPCRVVGKISKGDLLITSGIPGVAIAATGDIKVGSMIGKALENYDSDHIGTIEIVVGRG